MNKLAEIKEEFQLIFKAKTFDAILWPLTFVLAQQRFTLTQALILTLSLSIVWLLFRLLKKQPWIYSLLGTLGILVSGGLAVVASNANNYFVVGILTNAMLLLATLISLIIRRPLAIYLSHLSRGWSLAWFYRKDVFPAYYEVTIAWTILFVIRTTIQVYFYFNGEATSLLIANTLMGTPAIILVLTLSYLYGIYRLHQLSGPGIDEFNENKQPPYRGQTRGF